MPQPYEKLLFGLLVILACTVVGVGETRAGSTDSRLWPLPIDINLTSSFGEYRSGHLHAGLDIKTYGKEGVPCLAVGDGYVSRLRASPGGYGKVVYLTLASGETAVYAHLAEFAPALERALEGEQRKADRYRVDVYYGSDRFGFAAGDTIGYTGRTGTRAPHLHFEIRDEDQNPVNPLSHGWSLTDASAPTIYSALFVPLARHSSVDGTFRTKPVTLEQVGAGRYLASDTVRIAGVVGVGAHIIDRMNPTSGRLAPYRVELTVDGVLLSSITFESFTYTHTGQVDLTYDMERVRRDRKHYLLLFHRSGETLWNRTFFNGGAIDTEVLHSMVGARKDSYTAVIRTVDRSGNVSTALVPFAVEQPGETNARQEHQNETAGFYVFEDLLGIGEGNIDAARAYLDEQSGSHYVLAVEDVLSGTAADSPAIEFVGTDGERTYFLPLSPGEPRTHRLADLGVELALSDNSLYSEVFIHVSKWGGDTGAAANTAGLKRAAAPIRVGPLSLSLRGSFRIRYGGSAEMDDRAAFYRFDEREAEWRYTSSEVVGDTVVASVRSPGVYGVFVDEEPPKVSMAKVRSRQSYATGATIRELVIPVEDAGSGVDDERCVVSVNGRERIARWDGYLGKMFVLLREDTDTIELSVTAFDRAGNETRLSERLSRDATKN